MRVAVIFNPAAGRRRAGGRLGRFLDRYAGRVELFPTDRPGHAEELAARAAADGFDVVAAAGGDGTVHEVANGLLSAFAAAPGGDPGPALAVVPVGSANDYAHSLERQFGPRDLFDGPADPVDAGLARGDGGEAFDRYFVACLGFGLTGAVTAEARRVRWLQGVPLYGVAAWRALTAMGAPPRCEYAFDGGPPETGPLTTLSLLLGRREGNFLMAPGAVLDDGLFDAVRVGPARRRDLLRLLPNLAKTGPPADRPSIRLARCRSARVVSPVPRPVHLDGELPSGRRRRAGIDGRIIAGPAAGEGLPGRINAGVQRRFGSA